MAVATLSIDLVAKLASFEQDMGKAARAADKTAAQIAGAFGIIKAAAGGLAAGIGVGGLVAFTRSTIDSLDALNDLKDATGASIENISALEDVAVRTGTSLDTVATSLVKFNGVLKDAKPGSDAAQVLERLGLSAQELRRLDPAEALRQTAVALAGYADDGDKARIIQELFGKSLREVAPLLTDLAKQGELVAKVTTQQAEEAEKFNQQLFAMQKNLQDVSRDLAGPILTGMNGLIDKFREGTKAGDDFIVTLLKQTEIARLLGLNGAGKGFDGTGRNSGLAALTGSTQIGTGGYDRSAARLLRQGRLGIGDSGGGGGKGAKAKTPEGIAAITTELDRYMATLEQTIEREQQLTAVQTAQLRIAEAGANGFSEAQRVRILGLAAEIDKQKELNDAQEERIRIGRQAAIDQGVDNGPRAERLKGLLSNTDEERFARIRESVALLAEELESDRLPGGVKQYEQAVLDLIGNTDTAIEKTKSLVDELGLTFSSAFEDAIVGGKSFQDVLKGIGQDVLRITVRKAITDPLGGFFTKAIGSLFSFDGGGYTGNAPRSGGLDGKGGFLAMMHPQEDVIDRTKGSSSGGTVVVNINQQVGDIATVSMLQKSNESLVRQIQGGLMRSQQYGGAMA